MTTSPAHRIVYLALAIGRGHLMRSVILRGLLAPHGIVVDIVTTNEAGSRYLGALGCPSHVLPGGFTLVYDPLQNLDHSRTAGSLATYLACPHRGLRDWRELQRLADGASLIVNDSLHPALFAGPGGQVPVVAVHGEDLWDATEHHFDGRAPAHLARWISAALRRLGGRSAMRLVHTLEPSAVDTDHEVFLPPILACPRRSPDQVRAGLRAGERLAVVYLNPNFRDPALADAIEHALRGYRVHAVGEGYAGRPGWQARDPDLVDSVAAADLLVSAPGMGTLHQARLFALPLVAIVTDQPEQVRNVARFARQSPALVRAVHPSRPGFGAALQSALAVTWPRESRPDPLAAIRRIHAVWTRAFLQLLEMT